jgi:ankyrin repeat protein
MLSNRAALEHLVSGNTLNLYSLVCNIHDEEGNGVLHHCVKADNLEAIKIFVNQGAEINKKNRDGLSPFSYSLKKKKIRLASYLLSLNQLDLFTQDTRGWTPLMYSVSESDVLFEKIVTSGNHQLDHLTSDGWSVLQRAIAFDRLSICKKLIDLGANIELRCKGGRTALHNACYWGREEAVALLIDSGANCESKCYMGWTAYDYANKYGHEKIIKQCLA